MQSELSLTWEALYESELNPSVENLLIGQLKYSNIINTVEKYQVYIFLFFCLLFWEENAVQGFELRAYNFSHSTSLIFVMGSNCGPPDLCLLSN
jgi:hypothetical protein